MIRTGTTVVHRAPRRAAGRSPSRPGAPAEHIRLDRVTEAGAPVAPQRATNAPAIGEYLALAATTAAITSLPLHYCYGLSVLHSHLVAGAAWC